MRVDTSKFFGTPQRWSIKIICMFAPKIAVFD
jgi:hypothetical protein